ncbi:MAG: Na-translocating system protein MpsC family protein [Anaerovoracaceae bacterium]
MKQKDNHVEASLKREITRLYKATYGKGPETTVVRIFENIAIVRLEGALTQLELSLIDTDKGSKLVREIRDRLVEEHVFIYVPVFEKIAKAKLDNLSYTISNDKSTVYMFLIFEEVINKAEITAV